MLRLDIVYLAGRLRASHPLIRRIGLLLTVCSSPPLTVERTFSPSSSVECRPNQTGLKPALFRSLNHLPAVWLDSKRLSACVSHSAAALCVCVSDSRTATYCVVLVFAFEKAATVSLVFVQR